MLEPALHEIRTPLDAFRARVSAASSAADAESLWPLALQIDSAMSGGLCASPRCQEASRCLLWAVSKAIRAVKRSGTADLRCVCEALAKLEGGID